MLNVSLPSDNPVLDARSLSFPADGSVLRQVNLAVGEGETVAVHGPAGAGKTVLLGCLTGRLTPGSGSIWANGKAFHLFSADQRRAFQRRSFGLVPQRIGFVPELTLAQNTALPLLFTGIPRDQAAARALVWLERFELGEYAGRRIGTLPAEALRRAALARGMVTDPLILFADEPLAGLAEAEVATIARMLLSIARSHGTAVVCFTREDTMAARFQRRVDLSHGRTPNQPVPTAPLRAARAPKPAPLQPTVVQQPAATVSVIGATGAVPGASAVSAVGAVSASAAPAVPTAPAEPLAHTSGPWAAHTSPNAPTTRPPTRPARNSGPTNVLLRKPADLSTAQSTDAHDGQSAPRTPTASAATPTPTPTQTDPPPVPSGKSGDRSTPQATLANTTAAPTNPPPTTASKPVTRPMPWTTPSRRAATPAPAPTDLPSTAASNSGDRSMPQTPTMNAATATRTDLPATAPGKPVARPMPWATPSQPDAAPAPTLAGPSTAAVGEPSARSMPQSTLASANATPTDLPPAAASKPVARPMPWTTPSRPGADPAQRGPVRPPIPPKDPRHRGGLPLGAPSQLDDSPAQAQL